jgi:hypothetical protein
MTRDDLPLVALFLWVLSRAPAHAPPTRKAEAKRFRLLSPEMRARVAELFATVLQRTGLRLVLGSTRRTIPEQEALYLAGKSRVRGANAPHVRGVAVDVYEPTGAPAGFRSAWQTVARELGWHGMYSWDQGHIERRDS